MTELIDRLRDMREHLRDEWYLEPGVTIREAIALLESQAQQIAEARAAGMREAAEVCLRMRGSRAASSREADRFDALRDANSAILAQITEEKSK